MLTDHRNEKYFRPSKYPAINIIDFNDFIFNNTLNPNYNDPEGIKIPTVLARSAKEVVINFFSILREANQGAAMNVGCGSIGDGIAPYPIAYALLSDELHKQLSFTQFLKQFENMYHINLIAVIPLPASVTVEITDLFLVEIEALEGNSFCYYYSNLEVIKENTQYRINSLSFDKEDFFCASYHGWQHDAELTVTLMYGDWCGLIKKQYPAIQEKNIVKIIFDGTDGYHYMFVFFRLTNGTDLPIGQYKKTDTDHWIPVLIDPYQCVKSDKSGS